MEIRKVSDSVSIYSDGKRLQVIHNLGDEFILDFKVGAHRKAITCPSCKQAVFLSWATGIEGEIDEHGYYFHAVEPFNIRKINQEFQDAFEDAPPKHSFTIRNKMRG